VLAADWLRACLPRALARTLGGQLSPHREQGHAATVQVEEQWIPMAPDDVASPGHKLGQIIGVLLERTVGTPLEAFARRRGLYCDRQGDRPAVRPGRKVTWADSRGNPHDLDYVLERDGSNESKGDPVAFIESAWRRYTKHSRNKSGELEGALLPLRDTHPTVRFLGVVLAGEYSEGGLQQLRSAGIEVLHVPFATIAAAFRRHGLEIDYPEKATPAQKAQLNRALERVADTTLDSISSTLARSIRPDYERFEGRLDASVTETATRVRVITLFGDETVYRSVRDAIRELEHPTTLSELDLNTPRGYEVFIEYPSGARVNGRFQNKTELINFLKRVAS